MLVPKAYYRWVRRYAPPHLEKSQERHLRQVETVPPSPLPGNNCMCARVKVTAHLQGVDSTASKNKENEREPQQHTSHRNNYNHFVVVVII